MCRMRNYKMMFLEIRLAKLKDKGLKVLFNARLTIWGKH